MFELIFLLLPIAFLSGWRNARKRYKPKASNGLEVPKNFLQGVNYLFKQQPDKALDILLNYQEVDENTADTFLSLGNLFRSRGEVNRALRVHQYLVARADLSKKHRLDAMFALGEDFLAAGLLDRAERVFTEILQDNPKHTEAYEPLRHIYEKLQDWDKAIKVVEHSTLDKSERKRFIAHYLCEQAQTLLSAKQLFQAEEKLKQAAQAHYSARVKVLLGDLFIARQDKTMALDYYQQAISQEPKLLEMLSERLLRYYNNAADLAALYQFVLQVYESKQENQLFSPLIQIAERYGKAQQMYPLVEQALSRGIPSLRALARASHLLAQAAPDQPYTQLLSAALVRLSSTQAEFQCAACGYKMHDFLWRCPACQAWDTVKSS